MLSTLIKRTILLLLAISLLACASYNYSPDSEQLVAVSDCSEFSGEYLVQDTQTENRVLANLLGVESDLRKVSVNITEEYLEISASTDSGEAYTNLFDRRRSICADSVLTIVTKDSASTGALVMATEGEKLQLFSPAKNKLSMRLLSEEFYMFFILPLYQTSEEVLELERAE